MSSPSYVPPAIKFDPDDPYVFPAMASLVVLRTVYKWNHSYTSPEAPASLHTPEILHVPSQVIHLIVLHC